MKHITIAMANYNSWVNKHIYELCSSLPREQIYRDRKMFFGSIHITLNHILLVDILWLARLQGNTAVLFRSLDQVLYEEYNELRDEHVKHDRKLIEYTESLDDDELARVIQFRRMDGKFGAESVHEILWTTFNHQTHHRGQVHAMLSQIGIKNSDFPDLDVVDYLAYEKTKAVQASISN